MVVHSVVVDRAGIFPLSWGEDLFTPAHGIYVGPDDALYCTGDGDHTARKCTTDGRVLLEIGIPGEPAPSPHTCMASITSGVVSVEST